MKSPDWLARSAALLAEREQRLLLRRRRIVRHLNSTHIEVEGKRYVNFSSNNYLGLTHHPRMLEAIRSGGQTGSGAAALITGHSELHAQAEASIAQWKTMESAVLLPSGYQANLAAVQTLAGIGESYSGGVRFLIDKLAHASLIDAIRCTGASMRVFPHNGMSKLRRLLEESDRQQLQVVLTESIFSMDGDAADLAELAKLKQEHPFVLLLDEAHGSGVYGPNGAGYAAEMRLEQIVDVSIVTLSKALGCAGGAVCGSKIFIEALVNLGRAYIYTTDVSPTIPASVLTALQIIQEEPQRQERLRMLSSRIRSALANMGGGVPAGESPIIPVILGLERSVLNFAEKLREAGMWVTAVRPPTVAPGASRLRITLCCEHTDDEVSQLIQRLTRLMD